jgi:hypothetical protein
MGHNLARYATLILPVRADGLPPSGKLIVNNLRVKG